MEDKEGDADCPLGGKLLETYTDANGNGRYDPNIDNAHVIKKICSGENRWLVVSTEVAPGDADCPQGGTVTERFRDENGNGTYDATGDLDHSNHLLPDRSADGVGGWSHRL